MANLMRDFNEALEFHLNQPNKVTEILEKIEKSTSVKRLHIVQGLLCVFSLYMIIGHFAELICNFVGFVYPAYASITALETTRPEDDRIWLTYWVVFAFFSVIEFFSDIIFSWFPLYWLVKVVFLIWCFFPSSTNGSLTIYEKFIRPAFLKKEGVSATPISHEASPTPVPSPPPSPPTSTTSVPAMPRSSDPDKDSSSPMDFPKDDMRSSSKDDD